MVVVMDIQNFETAYLNAGGKASELEKEDGEYTSSKAQMAWEMWHAAQAVPEGFILVPKEPTPKMIDSTWHHDDEIQEMSHNTRNEFIYKSMIKAQEQSHD